MTKLIEITPESYLFIKDQFTVNGVTYGKIPSLYTKGKIANSKTKENIKSDNVYVRLGNDGKWYQTRMDKDAANINYHLNQQDIANRSNQIIDNQWRQGDGETIRVNQGDARARQQWFSNEDATKFLLTTAGLGALGIGAVSAPLATTLGLAGGYAGGKAVDKGMQLGTGKTWGQWASDKTGLPEWFTEFTNPGALAGGSLAGFGSAAIARNYLNPNSLLNQNIRTAIFNRKVPYMYDLKDPNNLVPFIEGIGYSALGKRIPQNSHAVQIYNYLNTLKKIPGIKDKLNLNYDILKPNTTTDAENYILHQLPLEIRSVATGASNRAVAFDKYLGLNKLENSPLFYQESDGALSSTHYYKNKDGDYTVYINRKLGPRYITKGIPNIKSGKLINENDYSFTGYDHILGTHGGMNGKLTPGKDLDTYNISASDVFDLMPFQKFNTWKYYNKIPKSIRNFEVSNLIPGAKPFKATFDFGPVHVIPHGLTTKASSPRESLGNLVKQLNSLYSKEPNWDYPGYYGRY